MWKKIGFTLAHLLALQAMAANPKPDHLQAAKKKYPYSLIGDDFGILTEEDLAANTWEAKPEPLRSEFHSNPFWQCFPVKNATLVCDEGEYDEDEKSVMAVLAIEVEGKEENYSYISRRALHRSNCHYFQKKWKKITQGQRNACISGPWDSDEEEGGKKTSNWTFDKFKTKRGCYSFFYGECDLKYQVKQGCKVLPASILGKSGS